MLRLGEIVSKPLEIGIPCDRDIGVPVYRDAGGMIGVAGPVKGMLSPSEIFDSDRARLG